MEFKNRIKKLRTDKNMSAADLSQALGKSESAIRMWEAGKNKPDADTLIKLSELFDCSTDYLLGMSRYYNANEVLILVEKHNEIYKLMKSFGAKKQDALLEIIKTLLQGYGFLIGSPECHLRDEYVQCLRTISNNIKESCLNYFAVTALLAPDYYDGNEFDKDDEIQRAFHIFDSHALNSYEISAASKHLLDAIEKDSNTIIRSVIEAHTGDEVTQEHLRTLYFEHKRDLVRRSLPNDENK